MSPARSLARFASRVADNIGITVSIGLSANKFLAKNASDLDKPRGFAVLGRDEAVAFLATKPVGFIWGVGKASQARLQRDGLSTVADLQRADETDLMKRYGVEGRRLWRLSRGIDDRSVNPERETKSVSAETTFSEDIADYNEIDCNSTAKLRDWLLKSRPQNLAWFAGPSAPQDAESAAEKSEMTPEYGDEGSCRGPKTLK